MVRSERRFDLTKVMDMLVVAEVASLRRLGRNQRLRAGDLHLLEDTSVELHDHDHNNNRNKPS